MERAYLERDAAYEGLFFLGVRTTGIFCRPTCPARKPLPKNVEYFPSAKAQPPWASDLLLDAEREPGARITDADLKRRGIDPATVRRYFLRRYGMTFQAFARARRLSAALGQIHSGQALDAAVLESGYSSHSGFRAAFARTFGDAPGKRRDGRCVVVSWLRSPLGPLVAGATEQGICLLEFSDRRMLEAQLAAVRKWFGGSVVPGTNPLVELLQAELAQYFAGSLRRFSAPLEFPGTPFQRRVWEELLAIPYGQTRSYEELARAVGAPAAVRAVGRANGLNRIAIVIPCHRVINKNGALGGYGGGLRRKQYLLELERSWGEP
jgi:AraC family transcriptional regulator of adaptative response/methylated-DNA-[protein]-cysteine methyltransferase